MKKYIIILSLCSFGIISASAESKPGFFARTFGRGETTPPSTAAPSEQKPSFFDRFRSQPSTPSAPTEQKPGFFDRFRGKPTVAEQRAEEERVARNRATQERLKKEAAEIEQKQKAAQRAKEERKQAAERTREAVLKKSAREVAEEKALFKDLQALRVESEARRVQIAQNIIGRHPATIRRKGINNLLFGENYSICGMLALAIGAEKASQLLRSYGTCKRVR